MYLLDTNACIKILNESSTELIERFQSKPPSEIQLCSVVKAELIYGARKSARPADNLRVLQTFFSPFVSKPFDDECSNNYGVIRSELERVGQPIGANDMMIASIALTFELTLVTHNVGEFSRIVGLSWEDWQEPLP